MTDAQGGNDFREKDSSGCELGLEANHELWVDAQGESGEVLRDNSAESEGGSRAESEGSSREKSKDASRAKPHVTVCTKPLHSKKQNQPVRAINEDDDGYDPYSDFHDARVSEPMFERDPWN